MKVHTIGFTGKSAEKFFGLLRKSGARRVVDVRLNNVSQLAGFAKKQDLEFFTKQLCGMDYVHLPELAPTKEMLSEYRDGGNDWNGYANRFLQLMEERKVQDRVPRDLISDGCLLCSEDKPHHCHRRLVAEYFGRYWDDVEVNHLV